MNRYWSTYVQTTEELYESRALKFRPENMPRWIHAMGLRDGTDILEVGCAGGLLCHRLQQALPHARVTGMDLDAGHIEYAKKKTAELGLSCAFLTGDATALPFPDGSFDAVFSHTVMNFCDPVKFAGEQYRVLRPGGRMIVMNVMGVGVPEPWIPTEGEEARLFDALWSAASGNPLSDIPRYDGNMENCLRYFADAGFRNVSVDAVSAVHYAPGWREEETGVREINEDRLSLISSIRKARALAPEGLTDGEYRELLRLANARYDEKIERYRAGERTGEFRVKTTLIASGEKPE